MRQNFRSRGGRFTISLGILLVLIGLSGPTSGLPSLSPSPQAADLEGFWKFEGIGAVAVDSSGNGNDGSLVNGVTREAGRIGNGVTFDGVDDHVPVTDLPDKPRGTISFFFRPASTFDATSTTTQGLWGKFESGNFDATISLRGTDFNGGDGSPGTIQTKIENSGATYLATTTNSWAADVWHHIALTWGGGTTRVYVNGIEENSTASSKVLASTGVDEIGRSSYDTFNIASGGPLHFQGSIDEFQTYSRDLTAEEIAVLAGGTGLATHWTFAEGSGTLAADSSGNGVDLTLQAGAAFNGGQIVQLTSRATKR